jgi:hypothetical protein
VEVHRAGHADASNEGGASLYTARVFQRALPFATRRSNPTLTAWLVH